MGAQLLKEVAVKTNDVAGDGTTTATVLARSMINEGLRNLAAGASPTGLRAGMVAATEAVLAAITSQAHPVKGNADIRRVATVSSGDEVIGQMVADAFDKVGKEGVVSVDEFEGMDSHLEFVEGMQLDRGYISSHLVTDKNAMEAVLTKAMILIVDQKLTTAAELLPALELIRASNSPLLIVAEDVQGDALATLVVNRIKGTLIVVAIKAPGFGDRRKGMLEDLASVTGGTVITPEVGLSLDKVTLDQLGRAQKIIVTKKDTTIIKGAGKRPAIEKRCEDLRRQVEDAHTDWDREKLRERLARLTGGVAVIKCGAATESAMKERKARIEDALSATRAAIESGVVPGGGVALVRAAAAIDKLKLKGDAKTGSEIVRRALHEPIRIIAENAGVEGGVVAGTVAGLPADEGYNAETGKYGNLVSLGVIDPAKVVTTALTNATSIATMVMSTEALIADAPEPEGAEDEVGHGHAHAGGGMGGMDGGMGGMGGAMGGMGGMDF
jgi:chaperonin GroEL